VGFGVCNLDLIYPVACRLALSEVNAPAIVIDESCRIFPRAPGEQEVGDAWISTRKPCARYQAHGQYSASDVAGYVANFSRRMTGSSALDIHGAGDETRGRIAVLSGQDSEILPILDLT
jgi:hypothetical protein